MKKYITEFIGTFFLMIIILCVVNNATDEHHLAPLAVGVGLIGLVYAGGHISKAHYNPAVTLAFYLSGTFKASDIPGYLIAQLVAVSLASLLGLFLFEPIAVEAVDLHFEGLSSTLVKGFIAEFLGAFMLIWVILQVAIAKTTKSNEFYGVAIGFTVAGAAYAFGSFGTYACFNPAVALGTWIYGFNTGFNFFVISLANFLAGIAALQAFKWTAALEPV